MGSCNFPFKFNRSWLNDPDFILWVSKRWPQLTPLSSGNDLDLLTHKLRSLKKDVKGWIREKSSIMESKSIKLDKDISSLLSGSSSGILSHEEQLSLTLLISKKKKLMDHILLTWQLKSRAKWALYGDSNTKFFHTLASGRRNQNTIWSLLDDEGHSIEDETALKQLGQSHFAHIFRDDKQTCLLAQLKVVMLYPTMITHEEAPSLIQPITLSEIEGALNSFKKDRSPGLDGWPVEFYLHFFDLLGNELLSAVDCARVSGCIPPSLNSTFLALIPKKENPLTFADFKPISLCNLLYKLISKVIVVWLKPFLDSRISKEQYGFLKNCRIVEPIGIVQETLRTVKTKNTCETKNTFALVLKLDLVKAFNRVNWSYIRLILIQIGVPLLGVNWIMGCLTSGNFAVLINGIPSKFFSASRGIRQGCPLSPLLFILVIEGLGLLISDAKNHGLIRGIKISSSLSLTHLLFVDDVILLGTGTLPEWIAFDVILSTFCKASRMNISADKSCFLFNNVNDDTLIDIARVLPYKMEPIVSGFKYLGYYLKPLGYKVSDWNWLIQKFENKIFHWSHKLLSLGGRLILVQAVLSSIPVYWLGLAPIPVSVLNKLRSLTFAFLWGSSGNNHKYHLSNWKHLSWPKKNGGWGIKNLH